MRDLIDRWKARATVQRELGSHNAASLIDQMVRDIELRLAKLAEGLAEPTGDGVYYVEGMQGDPVEVVRDRVHDRWYVWRKDNTPERLEGRRVWPVIDPRKGGA